MLANLPESAMHPRRHPAGIAWSAAVHLGVIAVATLMSTEPIDSMPAPVADTAIIYLPPPPEPQRRGPSEGAQPAARDPSPTTPAPLPAAPITVPLGLPPVDPFAPVIDDHSNDASRTAQRTLGSGADSGGDEGSGGRPYLVRAERGAALLPGNPVPPYPESLRKAAVEGRVLVEFVVDTAGAVELGTVRIIESDHTLFDAAVRETLPRLRFVPAEANGRRVRQLVRQPFEFEIRGK